jgi:hypothetical protein
LARHRSISRRAARVVAGACVLVTAIGVAACGSDSPSPSSANAGRQQRPDGARGAFLQDPKVQACLKKQGITIPTFRRPQNGQSPNGQPPNGQGQRPNGQRPNGNSAQFQKLRAALQKCGVTFPNGGGQGGAPPNGGTSTTNES